MLHIYRQVNIIDLKRNCNYFLVNSFLNDIQIVKSLERSAAHSVKVRPTCWIKPPSSMMKINVDAAISRHEDGGASAAVCRDGNGNTLVHRPQDMKE